MKSFKTIAGTSWEFLHFLWLQFLRDNCRQAAGALTYTTLFAVVPIMVVLFTVLKAFPALSGADKKLEAFIFEHFMPASGTEILDYLQTFASKSSQLTVVGVGMLFVTAILLLRTIERSINTIWGVQQRRRGIVSFLMYWAIISLGPVLLASGLLISSWVMSSSWLTETLHVLMLHELFYRYAPWFLNVMAFSLIYIVVPNCYVPWRAGVAGALVAATLFEVAKALFAWFVTDFSSHQLVYGAFAALPVFLLWVHLSWLIALFGVELVKCMVIWQPPTSRASESDLFQAIRILALLRKAYLAGDSVPVETMRAFLKQLKCRHWSGIRQFLLDQKLMAIDSDGNFRVGRDLEQVTLYDLLRRLPWSFERWQQQLSKGAVEPWQQLLAERWQQVDEGARSAMDLSVGDLLVRVEAESGTGQPAGCAQ